MLPASSMSKDILARSEVVEISDWAYLAGLTPRDRAILRERLTLISTHEPRFKVECFKENGKTFAVPRALFRQPIQGEWDRHQFSFHGELRPEQQDIVSDVQKYLNSLPGGIVKATTGIGKTVIGLYLAKLVGHKTLIIVPTSVIMQQWIERAKNFLGEEAGIIRQGTCDIRPITIGMIHTLAKERYTHLRDIFGFVIYDEVHKVPAETFSVTAGMFNCKFRLGLSATPRRKDGMENVFAWHIGPVISTHESRDLRPKVRVIYLKRITITDHGCFFRDGRLNLGRWINKIAKDQERNDLLASIIQAGHTTGRKTLILSDRLNHLQTLLKLSKIPSGQVGFVTGERKEGLDRNTLFGTYTCAGIGFDKPDLDTVILATPRSDVEQAVGRLLRRSPGKRRPVIVDIVDEYSDMAKRYWGARKKFYSRMEAEIEPW